MLGDEVNEEKLAFFGTHPTMIQGVNFPDLDAYRRVYAPTLTQVPPGVAVASIIATFLPYEAARRCSEAQTGHLRQAKLSHTAVPDPPLPPPITT